MKGLHVDIHKTSYALRKHPVIATTAALTLGGFFAITTLLYAKGFSHIVAQPVVAAHHITTPAMPLHTTEPMTLYTMAPDPVASTHHIAAPAMPLHATAPAMPLHTVAPMTLHTMAHDTVASTRHIVASATHHIVVHHSVAHHGKAHHSSK